MNYVNERELKDIIKVALKEDIGKRDATTELIIPKNKCVKAVLLTKQDCVICGLGIAGLVFKTLDKNIKFKPQAKDGENLSRNSIIATLYGNARSILTAERVALNFLSLLSGIATKTRQYVDKIKPFKAKIVDTRKTIPGIRILEKYAVRTGGGFNHRFKLDEMVLVKDNHLKVISYQLSVIRQKIPKLNKIEIEVKNLREFKEALKLKPDIIMLDNMKVKDIRKAVKIRNSLLATSYSLPKLEASGNITLKNVKKIASCGVDMISVGALTHSFDSADISLEIM